MLDLLSIQTLVLPVLFAHNDLQSKFSPTPEAFRFGDWRSLLGLQLLDSTRLAVRRAPLDGLQHQVFVLNLF